MKAVVKRTVDVTVASIALVLLSPLLLLVAALVKLDSSGPFLFKQERVGLAGVPFPILKFRTMVDDPRRDSPNVSPKGDPRTTRVGIFLRKWFIDELPQLVNVIRGDMSLVGPRPETPEYVALYTEDERRVLQVRPGMTGPSSVLLSPIEAELLAGQEDPAAFYVGTLLHDRVRLDLEYAESASLLGDLALLARTFLLVLGIHPMTERSDQAGLAR